MHLLEDGPVMSDTEELRHLRARVTELEEELQQPERRRRRGWRSGISGVLVLLACLLAPLSVASVWASEVLSDTDRYVETVAPIAEDPAVQQAIADEVTAAIMENLDVTRAIAEALGTLAQQGNVPPRAAETLPALAVPLSRGVEALTREQTERLFGTPGFAKVWAQTNRIAHTQVVALLEDAEGGAVTVQDDSITLELGPVIELVEERLVAEGFTIAQDLPPIDRSFVLLDSGGVARAQGFFGLVNMLGVWLPIVAVALMAAGVSLARDLRRALQWGALGVTAATVALGLGLSGARALYVDATPAGLLTPQAAGSVFDALVQFLLTGLRLTAVLGLAVALAAFVSGLSEASVRARATIRGGMAWLRGADAAGRRTGPFAGWVGAHRHGLHIASVAAGVMALMLWTTPSVWVVAGLALAVLLAVALIELLGRPPAGVQGGVAPSRHGQPAGTTPADGSPTRELIPGG
jgi:hypothetical protein